MKTANELRKLTTIDQRLSELFLKVFKKSRMERRRKPDD